MSSFYMELFTSTIVKGSLSNDSDDDNFKKNIVLMCKTMFLHMHHTF